ncbi:MAG: hypothetical protein NTV00_00030 [Methylococcales bacterium]|nr:hypothetical protein [Methylococcales bacterium]
MYVSSCYLLEDLLIAEIAAYASEHVKIPKKWMHRTFAVAMDLTHGALTCEFLFVAPILVTHR